MLKSKVRHLARDLEGAAFQWDGPYRLKRPLKWLDQFIELQPGKGFLDGQFTCNICWKFTAGEQLVTGVFDRCIRIGFLDGERDMWFSHQTTLELDAAYTTVQSMLKNKGVPFLDSVTDLKRMIELYEAAVQNTDFSNMESPTSPLYYFGVDLGWRHYNLASAYKVLNDAEKAKEHFQIVLEQYSSESFDWVQARKRTCLNAIHALS